MIRERQLERGEYTGDVEVLITEKTIRERVTGLAREIAEEYNHKGENLVLVVILTGATVFHADLIRALWREGLEGFKTDSMALSSYNKHETSGEPVILKDLKYPIEGEHALVVEDIADTGYSLEAVLSILQERNPESIKVAAFLSKEDARMVEVPIDFLGFRIFYNYKLPRKSNIRKFETKLNLYTLTSRERERE